MGRVIKIGLVLAVLLALAGACLITFIMTGIQQL